MFLKSEVYKNKLGEYITVKRIGFRKYAVMAADNLVNWTGWYQVKNPPFPVYKMRWECEAILRLVAVKMGWRYISEPGWVRYCQKLERKHNRKLNKKMHYEADECNCSVCGQRLTTHKGERMSYCPNCGAKMEEQ